MFVISESYAATYNATVLKDIGTNTPQASENPGTAPDTFREIKRILESQYHILTLTGTGTATTTDTFIIGSSSTGILVTLPAASTVANGTTTKLFVVKNRGAGTMTLSPLVDGVGSPTVSQNGTMVLFTNGTDWFEQRVANAATASNAEMLDNIDGLSYARSGANSDITSITGLTTPLAISQGGHAATTTAGAASNLGVGTEDSPEFTGLNVTSSGTITTLNSTTGNITNLSSTSGTITDFTAVSGTITTINSTTGNITNLNTTTGTVSTLHSQTGNIVYIAGTSGTLTGSLKVNGNVSVGGLSGVDYVGRWECEGTSGTGTLHLVQDTGINLVPVYNGNGEGTITAAAVGTASAAGWLDTGTQTLSIIGQPVILRGTLTSSSEYGIAGILDRDIPNTITLDNVTQISTRRLSDMQGGLDLATQTTGAISLATQTTGILSLATQTTGLYVKEWVSQGITGTGTLNLKTTGHATSSVSYDGNGNGTWTVSTLIRIQFIATNTVFTVPSDVSLIYITMGGGGGGGGHSDASEGSGGGAGAIVLDYPMSVTPSGTYTVTIGTPGLGATSTASNGVSGGQTAFGTVTANGGGGGGTNGGAVGSCGSSSVSYNSLSYSGGLFNAAITGGDGGGGLFGKGGTLNGTASGYGAGGGGGRIGAINGGAGSSGFCKIDW